MAEDLAALAATFGHRFRRLELLEQALTHSSYAHESEHSESGGNGGGVQDNEQMEFLGDAVLGFITSELLYQRFPEYHEGQLSKMRAHLVSARHLVEVARRTRIGDYLRLGRGEEKSGGREKQALLVNACEAVLAAIYLDGGMAAARRCIVESVLHPELARFESDQEAGLEFTDHKSALQELLQASGRPQPTYTVVKEEGPEHKKIFTVELRVQSPGNGEVEYRGLARGSTKKQAEQRAAEDALARLRGPAEQSQEHG